MLTCKRRAVDVRAKGKRKALLSKGPMFTAKAYDSVGDRESRSMQSISHSEKCNIAWQ